MYFRYFLIISPWKRAGPSFEQTWIPISQGCFVPSLVEIGPVVLEKKIFKIGQCIFAISFLSPLRKGRGPSLEQTWIPITQRMLCAKFGWNWLSGFGEEDFLILLMYFSLFRNYLPLEKGGAFSFEETWIHFTQGCFVQSFVEIGSVVLEKKIF